jgi:hypothetical protein
MGGGLVKLGGAGVRGEAAGEDCDSRQQRAAAEDLVGAALVDECVEVGVRPQQRRVEEKDNSSDQQQRPTISAVATRQGKYRTIA